MPLFPAPSIRQKLIAISMSTVVCALAAAGAVFFLISQQSFRTLVIRDVASTARMLADNSTAALSFGDVEAADEILESLQLTPHVDLACLYDAQGALFAGYSGRSQPLTCPASPPAADAITADSVALRRPVVLNARSIGTLYLRRNFEDLAEHERTQLLLLVLIVAGASALALFLSSFFQRFVSQPVEHLVQTTRAVSESRDYSLRATRQTDDELGTLVDSFNDMLAQVESRAAELQEIRAELELKIVELQREVAERRRMEEERTELLRREREASRLKDEFLATVSHELRTPLNAILGWSRLLVTGVLDPAASERALATIERNARSQAHLIEDLLDISRIMSGRMRLEIQRVDLRTVMEAALDAVRPAADAKRLIVEKTLDPAAEPVAGDPDRLQQIVWNLLSNAVKFTPEGGRVEVVLRRVDEHVEIEVADEGQGISPEFLPYVFDSFRQADSTSTRQHGGLGLGLAIVRHLTELHGGAVRAESAGRGAGARFAVRLPAMLSIAPQTTTPTDRAGVALQEDAPPIDGPRLDQLRVLVVEDEQDTLSLLLMVLEHYGAEVRGVTNVADALSVVERWSPDVLVSDIGLPGEDGYSLIEKLRARRPDRGGAIPAIALTAYARSVDKIRVLESGFQLHVPKPVEPADLVVAIGSVVTRRRILDLS